MKKNLKQLIRQHDIGLLCINIKRIITERLELLFMDDETAIRKKYKKRLGREVNLDDPQRFTEKLQWIKLNYRNPLLTTCVDKVTVRKYLTDKGYGQYLVPIVGVYNSPGQVHFNELPEKFILKASHGSSMHLVHTGGKIKNPLLWKLIMKSWLKMNIYVEGREWPYKNVTPRIICEQFIESKTENKLKDYKFFCFNGHPEFIQVDVDLLTDHHINFYDIDWNLLPIRCQYPNSEKTVKEPVNFELMKKIASDLSAPFPHVRIDFYEYDDQLRIGEMTFFDGSGFYSFHPDQYDFIFGEKMKLERYSE